MPTVILLDVSLSMIRPVVNPETGETSTLMQLAVLGIHQFLDHLSTHLKLEFTSLVTFSSLYEVICPFTRDLDSIKAKLSKIEEHDKTCLETGLRGVKTMVASDWGTSLPCQVILVTDGSPGIGQMSLKHSLNSVAHRSPHFPLPFPFPCKMHVITINNSQNSGQASSLPFYQRLVDVASSEPGSVLTPDGFPCLKTVQSMFQKLAETHFSAFYGTLKCGYLNAKISLSPTPQPYIRVTDFETISRCISDTIEVCGFIDIADVGNPMAASRHLVIPCASSKQDQNNIKVKLETDSDDEAPDEGKMASFCVLLHGALKVENMAALCSVGEDWFGFLYSWADNKKKSNLMLTLLEPGNDAVPWLGDLRYLGSLDDYPALNVANSESPPSFPVRPAEKRSYSQNVVVWIRQNGLQSDIQKILRHARKLPEKTVQFYKELNRVRKAALCFGFVELLDGLANIFERECTLLPGSAHPDCALQLTHAATSLRRPPSRDKNLNITPLKTKFQSEHD